MAGGGGMLLYAATDSTDCGESASLDCVGDKFGEYSVDLVLVGAGVVMMLVGTVGLMASAASRPVADPDQSKPTPTPPSQPASYAPPGSIF